MTNSLRRLATDRAISGSSSGSGARPGGSVYTSAAATPSMPTVPLLQIASDYEIVRGKKFATLFWVSVDAEVEAMKRDAERYRKLLMALDAAEQVSNEASMIRNIIEDSIGLGSECLNLHLDAMAKEQEDKCAKQ